MQQHILKLLDIRSHESALVKQLFLVQFFLVIGSAFLFVTANAIFLSVYHIIELPKAFLITGIFLLIFNRIYNKMEHRISTKQLFYGIIFVSIVITIAIRIFMFFPSLTWMPYVLLIWYNIVYLLTGLVFWGLAAMLFNVRESKRIFTIIGAGDVPAKLLGYLSVSLLAPYIGLGNMLWIAAVSFVLAFVFAQRMFSAPQIKALQVQHNDHQSFHPVPQKNKKIKKIFGADLILYIAALSLITFLALILIDFTFLAEVKVKYHTDIELAYFLGIFFAAGRILAAILKFTLSSRLINRIGLAGSLLLSPVILLLFTAFIISLSGIEGGLKNLIYLFGIMALLTEILKSTVQEPIFLVLFQPLKLPLRLKGHVIAKGYMLAASLIIMGGLLVTYLAEVPQASVLLFCYALAIILVLWIISIFLVKKEYLITLHNAVKTGFFQGNELFLNDNTIINLLLKKTESEKPAEAIYALDLLEKSGYENMNELLVLQLKKSDPVIIEYVLGKIILHQNQLALNTIEEVLTTSADNNIKAKCIQAISILQEDNKEKLVPYLNADNIPCQRAAIIGLLKSGDLEALLLAGNKLLEFVYADDAQQRITGAEIIGATGEKKFYKTLIKLINDKNITVQKKAIESAATIKNKLLLPPLVEKLQQRSVAKGTILTLSKYENDALNFYANTISSKEDLLPQFIKVAGGINTPQAFDFLKEKLFACPVLQTEIVNVLWEKKYIGGATSKRQLLKLIHTALAQAKQIVYYENDLPHDKDLHQFKNALQTEINIRVTNIFKMLSFIYDSHKINGAMNALALKKDHKTSNALEMLELIIPKDIFRKIIFLLETSQQKGYKSKQKGINLQDILKEIIQSNIYFFNNWTRAMAVALIGKMRDPVMLAFLKDLKLPGTSYIIEETRLDVIANVKA